MVSSNLLQIAEIVGTILVPILGSVIGYLIRQIRSLEQRIEELEETKIERSYTLFGVEDDPNSQGIADEVVELRKDVSKLHHDIRYVRRVIEDLDTGDRDHGENLRSVQEDD